MTDRVEHPAAGRSVIVIVRDGEGKRDAIRRYKIMIDGRHVASIRRGGRREIVVPPGPHVVQLRIDWCSSPALPVDLADGEQVVFRCRPGERLPDPLASVTVARDQYIRLELVGTG